MNQTSGQSPPQPPHELRFSKGNWIAFVILMLAGWYHAFMDTGQDVPIEAFYSDRPIIVRMTDQQIQLGTIAITPIDGWTYLKVSGKNAKPQRNFVNQKQALIVTIKPVNFREWPPTVLKNTTSLEETGSETAGSKEAGSKETDRPPERTALKIETVEYSKIAVEWFSLQQRPYGTFHEGRINTDRQEYLIQVMSQREYVDGQMAAVKLLCDQITRTL